MLPKCFYVSNDSGAFLQLEISGTFSSFVMPKYDVPLWVLKLPEIDGNWIRNYA